MLIRGLSERYYKALHEGKISGYLFEQQNYVPKAPEPAQK